MDVEEEVTEADTGEATEEVHMDMLPTAVVAGECASLPPKLVPDQAVGGAAEATNLTKWTFSRCTSRFALYLLSMTVVSGGTPSYSISSR